MMRYKGYLGAATVDDEAGVIRGKVVGIRDTITFQGTTVEEVRRAFRESVDDYLEFCASRGEAPDKPFSGRLLIRTKPSVHQAVSAAAQARGESLNAFANRCLRAGARKALSALRDDDAKLAHQA